MGIVVQNGGESTNAADLKFNTATGGSSTEKLRITSVVMSVSTLFHPHGNQVQTQPHYKLMVLLLPALMIQISLLQVMHIGMVLTGIYTNRRSSQLLSILIIVGMFSVQRFWSPGGAVSWTNPGTDTTGAILT